MTVFFNFFKKSATKRLLAYRYGARKGNLTFFENRSLNRWLLSLYDVKEETIFNFNLTIRSFHSLYEVKEEKSFEKVSEIQDEWTVLCERGKTIFILYSKALFVSSVGARKKKLYFIS